ncbi:MAG: imidazole glycerol phosphate synthase subunit HisH [Verrucomicrobiota bacterium]
MKVGLIDYDRGNLRSVEKALEQVGCAVERIENGDQLADSSVDLMVLPGVGSFGDAMQNLRARDLVNPIKSWFEAGKPFLGICLGFQLLFDSSEESVGVPGLGLFPGRVVRFPDAVGDIPHMGWNQVSWKEMQGDHPLASVFTTQPYFYHVHSYYPETTAECDGWCQTEYGVSFASGIVRGKQAAFQFHPEKSQQAGLDLLKSFVSSLG